MFLPRRLNKFLHDATPLSVREIEEMWEQERIHVSSAHPEAQDGNTGLARLVFENDVVSLDGRALKPRRGYETLVFNKPRSVTSTIRDPRGKADLGPWLEKMPEGAFPIGRLDRDTTGLLLITTDGDLCNAVLRPEHHTDKVYWLWLNEHLCDDDPRMKALTDGVAIQSRLARAKAISVQDRTPHFTELLVTLNEGKNRQIRRMCRALDLRLVQLHRKSIGSITLRGVAQGDFRPLSADEVESLWQSTGGRHRLVQRQIEALERRAKAARDAGQPHARLETWLASRAKVDVAS